LTKNSNCTKNIAMLSEVMAVLFPQDSKVFHALIHSFVTVPRPLPDIVEFWRMSHDCRRTLGDMGRLSGVPVVSFNPLIAIQGLQQRMAKDCDVIPCSTWERALIHTMSPVAIVVANSYLRPDFLANLWDENFRPYC
jgi:hypothetical protein